MVTTKRGPVLNNLYGNFAWSENIHFGTMWDATIKIFICFTILTMWIYNNFKHIFDFNTASHYIVNTHCSSRICTDVKPMRHSQTEGYPPWYWCSLHYIWACCDTLYQFWPGAGLLLKCGSCKFTCGQYYLRFTAALKINEYNTADQHRLTKCSW